MPMILTIRHLSGSLSGRSQRIVMQEGQALRLGRSPENDIKLSDGDDSVSGVHAELFLEGGRLFVEDKRSANGTFVNGAACPPFQRVAVPEGSRLRLAQQGPEMQITTEPAPVRDAGPAAAATASAATAPPKEAVGRTTMLREIDRARQEERDVVLGQVAAAKKSTGLWVTLGLMLVLLLAAGGIAGGVWWNHRQANRAEETLRATIAQRDAEADKAKTLWADVNKRVSPAVVHIRCRYRLRGSFAVDSRRSVVLEVKGAAIGQGEVAGSGVLIRPGLILTALHVAQPWKVVIKDWDTLEESVKSEYDLLDVQFPGQQPINASFVAGSAQHDLALLQVQVTDAPTVQLGGSNADIKVTDKIATIGYPGALGQYFVPVRNLSGFGEELRAVTMVVPTFTEGTVSQPLTGVGDASHYVFFNAAIEPGNSGGPMLNEHGQLIGIVSQQFLRSGPSLHILGKEFPTLLPSNVGNMAVSLDDVHDFLQKHGIS